MLLGDYKKDYLELNRVLGFLKTNSSAPRTIDPGVDVGAYDKEVAVAGSFFEVGALSLYVWDASSSTWSVQVGLLGPPITCGAGGTNSTDPGIDGTGEDQDITLYPNPGRSVTISGGHLKLNTAARTIWLKQSSTGTQYGPVTLNGTTPVVVTTSSVSTGDLILLNRISGANAGFLTYTISNGTSFSVTSSNILDTGTFWWWIIKKA